MLVFGDKVFRKLLVKALYPDLQMIPSVNKTHLKIFLLQKHHTRTVFLSTIKKKLPTRKSNKTNKVLSTSSKTTYNLLIYPTIQNEAVY